MATIQADLRPVLFIKYCSFDKINKNKLCGACDAYLGRQKVIENFGRKAEDKRQVGGPRCRWENNIKMKL
jgi:hypothetical protein